MKNSFTLTLLILFFPLLALTQREVTFVAHLDGDKVYQGDVFQISFKLTNAKGKQFNPPDFSDFTIVSGPNQSSSFQAIQGKYTSEIIYSYGLLANKAGKFSIGRATISANGKKMTANALNIEVLLRQTSNTGLAGIAPDQSFFILAETSTDTAFLGQQILVDFKLYTTKNIQNYNIISNPSYQGFYAKYIRVRSTAKREIINNAQYTTKILRRVALFPQQIGTFEIEPMIFQLGVADENTQRRGFFFSQTLKTHNISSPTKSIEVLALPKEAPDSFNGAVGNFSMIASASRNKLTTDDALSLKLQIKGDGDEKRILPPLLDPGLDFEVYEPKVINEQSYENTGKIIVDKVFEYLLIPTKPGTYKLSPEFSYFDPEKMEYQTIKAQDFELNVGKGSGVSTQAGNTKLSSVNDSKDIRYIQTKTKLKPKNSYLFGSAIYWGLAGFPLLFFLGLFLFQVLLRNSESDPAALKFKRANKVAIKRLKIAHELLQTNHSRNFYDEISKALFGYAGDKLKIPLSELSSSNIESVLNQLNVHNDSIKNVSEILKTCETALFAGMDNHKEMRETYDKTVAVITQIEKNMS